MMKIKIDKNYSMMVSLFSLFILLFSFVIFSCDNPLIQRIVEPKTATFESNGGSHVENQTVFKGQPVRKPSNPSKSGFAFAAWYSDNETFLQEWDFSSIPNKDITLYAKWIAEGAALYTVTFNSNGGDRDASPPRRTVESGSLVTPPDENPMRDSFEFGGWYRNAECTDGNEWDFAADTVSGDITLYAKWVEIAGVEYFTVTFNSNGGETDADPPNRRVVSGRTVAPPAEPPARTGYTVSGWYREAECVNEWDFAADTVSADITLYARWDISLHTVTFIADGGTPAPQAQSIAHGGKADAPAAMDKPGYTFIGWYTEAEGGREWVFAEDAVTANTTLYARWEPIPVSNTHSVTFNSGGGTTVPSQIVASGQKASEPQGVTKDGYTLAGWFRDNTTFQNQWNFAADTVIADITLYAKWVAVPVAPSMTWTAVADSTFGSAIDGTSDIYAIAYANNTWVAVGSGGKMATSPDGVTWTAVANSTFGSAIDGTSNIRAIAYGNNTFVAGGNEGKMAYSINNGVTWTAVTNSTFSTTEIRAIAYGNNRFVAGDRFGEMAYSTDNGVTWTAVADSTFDSYNINAIAYGNNRWVAVGYDGKRAYSDDNGVTWTAVTDSIFGTSDIFAIAYANGRFVAVGYDGKMAYSGDYDPGTPHTHTYSNTWSFNETQHWRECTAGDGAKSDETAHTYNANLVCTVCGYNNATPVTFSTLTANGSATATTTELTLTFSAAITGLSASDITLSGVAGVSKGTLSGAGPTYTLPISGFTSGGTLTVTVAKAGYTISGSPKTVTIYYSPPASPAPTNWTAVSNTTFGTSSIDVIAYGNNTWVAGGASGKMAYSSDNGVTWTAISSTDDTFGNTGTISTIAYGKNTWVAGGAIGANGIMAYSSDNGVTWTDISSTNNTFGSSTITRIAYDNNTWVAGGGGGKMAYSSDGINWTAVADSTFGSSAITEIAYGNGTFVAGGQNGKMAYSSDGINWTAVTDSTLGSSSNINAIAYGNDGNAVNRFVIGGFQGKMAYSTDNGITWTAVADSTFDTSVTIYAIAYANNRFVAVGSSGRMAYSSDGVNWTAVADSTFGTSSIRRIAYSNNRFVAVGDSGKMAYCDW